MSSKDSKNTGFSTGLFLGAIFGGASLFFFGTKTGKKVKNQIKEEINSGDLDMDRVKSIAQKQISKIIKDLNIKNTIHQASKTTKSKSKKSTKENKNFFSKKGKKLGKA